jgi:hypothetical protein
MRNIATHPITKEEIENCLIQLADEILNPPEGDMLIGDMRPALLYTAARIVKESTWQQGTVNV